MWKPLSRASGYIFASVTQEIIYTWRRRQNDIWSSSLALNTPLLFCFKLWAIG